jgi:GlcNAc-P-P-Und epimerase
MRVVVTGGSGFIGTNLVQLYVTRGVPVMNLDVAPPANPEHHSLWRRVDLLDGPGLRRAVEDFGPTHVAHLAARTDLEGQSIAEYAANTRGVSNLIYALQRLPNLKRVAFASSRLVCKIGYQPLGDQDYCPSTVYGESKVAGEQLVREAEIGCSWVLLRPTSIWGPWFSVPYRVFFDQIARRRYFHPRGRRILKSFGFVGNTVHQLDTILDAPNELIDGKTIYLADYPAIEVGDMAQAISRRMRRGPIRTVPVPVLRAAATLGDALKAAGWEGVPLTTFRLNNLLTEMTFNLTLLEQIVGPLPYSRDQGIDITVAWMENMDNTHRKRTRGAARQRSRAAAYMSAKRGASWRRS